MTCFLYHTSFSSIYHIGGRGKPEFFYIVVHLYSVDVIVVCVHSLCFDVEMETFGYYR